jgi:hypothetical protein
MKAQILEKKGKKEFVVLMWEDYEKIQEILEDYDDLKELRKAKKESKGQKPVPFEKAIQPLGLEE